MLRSSGQNARASKLAFEPTAHRGPTRFTSHLSLSALIIASTALVVLPIRPAHAFQPTGPTREYVVQPGDTLLGIALAFGVSMAAIQLHNDLDDPALIRADQKLNIPLTKRHPDENAFWVLHTVRRGETLSEIAARHRVKLADVTRVNNIADASTIRVGQKLVIPVSGTTPPEINAQEQTAPAEMALVPLVPLAPMAAAPAQEASAAASPPLVAEAGAPASGADGTASTEIEAMRARLLELYNQARIANGAPPLAYSFVLQAAAQGHAEDCAARGSGSHIGSDGSKSSQRIARAGYPGRITGENWAWARSAEIAFDMWYTQEIAGQGPHLKNILSPRYREVGFGIAASRGGYYLIANFGG